jgi:hypothetical protein
MSHNVCMYVWDWFGDWVHLVYPCVVAIGIWFEPNWMALNIC